MPKSITLSANGQNILISGLFVNTVDFDPGAGIFEMTSAGFPDVFICEFDVNGNFNWAKKIGGADIHYPSQMATDSDGNIYISGRAGGVTDFDTGPATFLLGSPGSNTTFMCKLNQLGELIWVKTIGTYPNGAPNGTNIDAFALDAAGNIYMTGVFSGTVDFDPSPNTNNLIAAASMSDFVTKFNVNGDFVWVRKSGGGTGNDYIRGNSIASDANGNIWMAGDFRGDFTFDTQAGTTSITTGTNTSPTNSQIFMARLDSAGNYLSATELASTGSTNDPSKLLSDNEGNFYLIGSFNGTSDFDPGQGVFNVSTVQLGGREAFVSKIDPSGNLVWVKNHQGGASYARGMAFDVNGGIYLTGQLNSSVVDFEFGSGVFEMSALPANTTDAFITKWAVETNGLQEQTEKNGIIMYPNPASSFVTIQAEATGKGATYSVIDVLGRQVKNGPLPESRQLDVSKIPEGSYIIRVDCKTDGIIKTAFLVVKH
ncbi:MAG: T9SS type A sorting domain-containing protein [Chitinophagaceae bacterium]|nr:MAG: T9SS type A sorting domain-containing protein [Chitinophagaceae bacterium]